MVPLWVSPQAAMTLWMPLARLAISLAEVQALFPGMMPPRPVPQDWLMAYG